MRGFSDLPSWFGLTRRQWLRWLMGIATYVPAAVLAPRSLYGSSPQPVVDALGPFLDTLLPGDQTPSASELGVDAALLERMKGNERMARAIVMGCAWLDEQAVALGAENFSALPPEQREAIVKRAEEAAPRTLPRVFFAGVLPLAYEYYYAHPDSWPALGYAGPPQPRGFMDYAGPPGGAPR